MTGEVSAPPEDPRPIDPSPFAGSALGELARAEIDVQVATAKAYPRSLRDCTRRAEQLATLTQEVAAGCVYALPRAGKKITGPSVRLAEIMASAWGNLRFGARVVGDDGRFLTVQGFAHDLETNTAFAFELKVKVTGKDGRRYSDDMIAVTANAAQSKALRNAVFRVVPRALVDELLIKVRAVAAGDAKTLPDRRARAVDHLKGLGVGEDRLLALAGKRAVADLDGEDLLAFRSLLNSVKEGEATLEAAFPAAPDARTRQALDRLRTVAAPAGVPANGPTLAALIERATRDAGLTEEGLGELVKKASAGQAQQAEDLTELQAAALAESLRGLLAERDAPPPGGRGLFPSGGNSAQGL